MKTSQLQSRHDSVARNFCSPSLFCPHAGRRGGWGVAGLMLAALLIFASSAAATDYSWKTAASGNWSTTTAWNPTGTPGVVGDTVTITNGYSTTTKTVTLDVPSPNVSSIILSNGVSPFAGWRITPNTSSDTNINMFYNPSNPKNVTIREDSANDIASSSRITANLTLNTNLDITVATNSLILFGQIRGANFTVTKYGLGAVDISGVPNAGPNNSFSNLVIVAGSFIADCLGANLNTLCPGGIVINSGATLKYGRAGQQVATNCAIINNGIYDLNGAGATTIATVAGSGVITDFKTTGATNTLTLAGVGNSTFSGNILNGTSTNILGLVKIGASTLTLAGTNIMGGSTTITNTSTLLVNGAMLGAGTVNITAAATLGGTGTILSPVALTGTLVAGNNGGTLTVSNVTGIGSVIVSNASLAVLGQVGLSGSAVSSVYFNNCTNTLTVLGGGLASIYTTNLNVDGVNNTLKINFPNPVTGQYPLIAVAAIGGLNGFAGLNLSVPVGMAAYLSNNVGNASIDLVITSAGALVWRGTPNGDWSIGGSANWLNGASAAAYTEAGGAGPFVNFDDTLTGTAAVNLTTTVTPMGINVSGTTNYTITGSGLINGSASLVKTGSGTLTIANTASNTYSGGITISGGAISMGNGGTAGNIGVASVANSGALIFNRSDVVTIGNAITGTGTVVNQGAGTTILTATNAGNWPLTINAGMVELSTSGTRIPSGAINGAGALGVTGGGTVILTNNNNTYSGGDTVFAGTLQFGDGSGNGVLTPGNITNNGAVAFNFPTAVTDNNNISGSGSVTSLGDVALAGNNTYAGSTWVKSGTLTAGSANGLSPNSALIVGNMNGSPANLNCGAFSPVVPSLMVVGSNAVSPASYITLGSGQSLTVNGNFSVGDTNGSAGTAGATMNLSFVCPDSSCGLTVNTNGGVIQFGLTTSASQPNWLNTDFSALGYFTANLGATGALNVGELNTATGGNSSAYDYLTLAQSNVLNAGSLRVGTGGKAFTSELRLGSVSNNLNVNTIILGANRDSGKLLFAGGSGAVTLRGFAGGASSSIVNVGANVADSTSGAGINTVDLTGHSADLLISTLTLGNQPARAGIWTQTFSFDTGVLNVTDVELSLACKTAVVGSSTLNLHGGTSTIGSLNFLRTNSATTASATLDIANSAVVSVLGNVLKGPTGTATLNVNSSTLTVNGAVGAATNQMDAITLNSAILNVNLAGTPVTAPVQATSLTIDNTTITVNGSGLTVGQVPVLAYGGGGLNGAGFAGLTLVNPPGVSATLSNNLANSSIDLVVTSITPLAWKGSPNGNWDIGSIANWQPGVTYADGDRVLFDDTATGTTTVNLTTSLSPSVVTFNNSSKNYTWSGTGNLTGGVGITKNGSGTLTMINSGNNDFTGGLALNSGSVIVGNGGTAGSVGSGSLLNNGQITFNRSDDFTLANGLSGSGTTIKQGANRITLSGANSATGPTVISAGTLEVANGGGLGSGNVTNNSTLVINRTTSLSVVSDISGTGSLTKAGTGTLTLTGNNNVYAGGTVVSNSTLQIGNSDGTGSLPVNGSIALVNTNSVLFISSSNNINLAGQISGLGSITLRSATLTNAMLLTLSGSNSFAGPVNCGSASQLGGTIQLLNSYGFGGSAIAKTVNVIRSEVDLMGGIVTPANITFATSANAAGTGIGMVALRNVTGTNIIQGPLVLTGGGASSEYTVDSGQLVLNGNLVPAATGRTMYLSGAAEGFLNGVLSDDTISNYVPTVVKGGTGTWSLNGLNTYSGITTVTAGTLLVNGAIGTNSVTVSGGTLGGTGVIGGSVLVSPAAALAPGNGGLGKLTVNNSVTLEGNTMMELNKTAATNDVLAASGAITYGGTLTLTNLAGSFASGDTFKLFNAGAYAGAFTNVIPAIPAPGFTWNTDSLITNGVLSVVSGATPAVIGSIAQVGPNSFSLTGTGAASQLYNVYAYTNLAAPMINWWLIGSTTSTAGGVINYLDTQATNVQRFYLFGQ